MSLFLNKIEIPDDKPFANCKLGREKYASVLTDIIKSYPDGFVLAIDNKWGEGKTTFVEMWQKALRKEEYKTIYFNAWENDFEKSPFVAIVAEFKLLLGGIDTKAYKDLMTKGTKVAKALIPAFTKTFIKKHFGDDLGDIAEKGAEGAMEIFEDEIKEYAERKESMKEFKIQLEQYIEENSKDKPIVVIIDELDRCRPDYAVEILENIKHLFSVRKIVFVLSVDKTQLGHAICGYYGSDKIDTAEYLRRFIDVEYSIPQPDTKAFIQYLFTKYNFYTYFTIRPNNAALNREKGVFLDILEFLFNLKEVSLRQQEKIFTHLRIALNGFAPNNYVLPEIYVYLTILKMFHNDKYELIMNRKVNHSKLLEINSDFLREKNSIPDNKVNLSIHLEALLIVMYNNYLDHNSGKKIDLGRSQNLDALLPNSKIAISSEDKRLRDSVRTILDNSGFGDVELEYLFRKIELTDPIIKKQ